MVSQVKTQAAAGEQDAFLELPRKMVHAGRAAPRLDAVEADGMIEMIAEVPGVPDSAISITLDGDVLTIEVDKDNPNAGKRTHFNERLFGHFRRSIQLPFAPDPEKFEAALQDGLLTIRFPRVERGRSHKIEVRAARPDAARSRGAIGSGWSDRAAAAAEPLTLDVKATPAAPARDR